MHAMGHMHQMPGLRRLRRTRREIIALLVAACLGGPAALMAAESTAAAGNAQVTLNWTVSTNATSPSHADSIDETPWTTVPALPTARPPTSDASSAIVFPSA